MQVALGQQTALNLTVTAVLLLKTNQAVCVCWRNVFLRTPATSK